MVNFDQVFLDYLFGHTKQNYFYINQLQNIILNCKMLISSNMQKTKFLNLFSFQIAFLIENMAFQNINTKLFDQALQINSIKPFLDKCKEIERINSFKKLALEFSYFHASIPEKSKKKITVDKIHPDTFQKELSLWNKGKTLPSLIKMIVITNSVTEIKTKEYKIGVFLQLFMIRGLLYVQKKFNLDANIKVEFIEQLKKFRVQIKECYLKNQEDKIFKLQTKYLIDFSDFLKVDDLEIKYQLLKSKIDEFLKLNDQNIIISELMLDIDLINEFNQCKSKNDYIQLLEKISSSSENNPYYNCANFVYISIKFIISIKIEDKKIFKKQFKLFDRSFSGMLTHHRVEYHLEKYIILLENKFDFVECLKCIGNYFKNYQQ